MSTQSGNLEISPHSRLSTRFRRYVKPRALITIGIGLFAVALLTFNYFIFAQLEPSTIDAETILYLLIADLAVGLVLASYIAWRIIQLWIARRSGSAGSRLHSRIVTMFSILAVTPAIFVAAFSAVLFNMGIEAWFSNRVKTAIDNSVQIAERYVKANVNSIRLEIVILVDRLSQLDREFAVGAIDQEQYFYAFRRVIEERAREGNLAAIYLLSSQADEPLLSYELREIEVEMPNAAAFAEAFELGATVTSSEDSSQIRGLYSISEDRFYYLVRLVDPQAIEHLALTADAIDQFRQAEDNRFGIQLTFLLMYVVVAVLLLLAAIWCGLWAANRLVIPIGRLVGAAERISEGDLSARVEVANNDDEISTLGRSFNRMTGQLQSQRSELIEANRQFDQRRRFTETVLSGVSAGVVGIDSNGRVNIANRSALDLLDTNADGMIGQMFSDVVPEMAPLVNQALSQKVEGKRLVRGQVEVTRDDIHHTFNVRVTSEIGHDDARGLVITFDDITDLVVAQRTAAWADVARRIAHEIKNPLTPIQLSAERLRRKYKTEIGSDPEVFDQCTDTIIRQVNDIGRMVDEFSSFARMPEPVMKTQDICDIARQAVFMQKVANAEIAYETQIPDQPIQLYCDGRLLSQALTNVLKNAGEAIETQRDSEDDPSYKGTISLKLTNEDEKIVIEIIDNGCGLPREHRNRLTEPYMTTRAKGTGLGLAIVRKVLEDHHGELLIDDRPISTSSSTTETGARVRFIIPNNAEVIVSGDESKTDGSDVQELRVGE